MARPPRFRLVLLALVCPSAAFAACGDDTTSSVADGGASDGSSGDASDDASDGALPDASITDAPDAQDEASSDASAEPADASVEAAPPLPLQGAIELSSRYGHTCAVREGGVSCWGWNLFEMLGVPGGAFSSVPVTVQGISDAIEIAAGGNQTCALRADRTVVCWGSDGYGQLGQGAPTPTSAAPLPVPGLADVRSLSSGYRFVCAVRHDRAVVCWGNNESGELGVDAGPTSHVPVVVPGVADAELVSCGIVRSCVVHVDRTVSCWGDGQPAAAVSGATEVVSVAVGFGHGCALRADRTVVCWGDNDRGQLGPGATGPSAQAVEVTGLDDVVAIGAGVAHTCAVRAGGGVVCWGSNESGSLGAGDAVGSFSAAPLPVPITDALAVTGGQTFACARHAGGKVSCWGGNNVGQLGAGTDAGSSSIPLEVVGF